MRLALPAALATLLLLMAGCFAGSGDAPEGETFVSEATGAVAGVVVDEAIRPVPGVTLTTLDGRNATTDDGGLFLLPNLEPGFYALAVRADGYLPVQASADVAAGETTSIKVQLYVDPAPKPYYSIHPFEGFMQAWGGIGQFVAEIFLDNGTGLCNCRLEVQPDANATEFIIEAFWEHSFADPAGLAEYYLSVEEVGEDGFLETDYCYSPCRMQLSAQAVDYAGGAILARLDGADAWPSYNQQFQLFITVFYNGPAPEGWSVMDEGA